MGSDRQLALTPTSKTRAGHFSGRHVFGYNSPAAIARELFKPFTDAESLIDSSFF